MVNGVKSQDCVRLRAHVRHPSGAHGYARSSNGKCADSKSAHAPRNTIVDPLRLAREPRLETTGVDSLEGCS